jgi:hypothetical protein
MNEGMSGELELTPIEVPRSLDHTGTDESGNPVVTPMDVQFQVVHPLGHFERFTFENNTPVPAVGIGYAIEPPPGPRLDRLGAGGTAPANDVWVDSPDEGEGRRIVVDARIEMAPLVHLHLDYTSGLPAGEEWVIRRAVIRVEGADPGSLVATGTLEMELEPGQYVQEHIPPHAFELHT